MIRVDNLVFDYMTKRALYGVSFEIKKGSIVALIGPNGAGKTTLMRCLAGLVKPFSGEIYLDNINVAENSRHAHKYISYLSDVFGLYDNLTAKQCLRYTALAFEIPNDEIDDRIVETAAMLNLTEHLETYAGNLSRGLRQRLAIALGIIHRPQFIILDEPASGLDPEARIELSNLFINLKDKGHTLLISSHILAELEDYATDVIVLNSGRIVKQGSFNGDPIRLDYDTNINLAIRVKRDSKKLVKYLEDANIASDVSYDGIYVRCTLWGQEDELHALLKALIMSNIEVIEYKIERSSLKNTYFETVKEDE